MGAQSFPASGFKKAQAERTKTATVDASTDDDDSSAAVQAGKGAVDERGRQIIHVDWERPYDPGNPQNWNNGKRWYLTLLASMWAFTTALCASAYSPLAGGLSKKYHVAKVVILLGNCTLQSSNSTADMFITPLSETVGRVPLYCASVILYVILFIPQALSYNVEGLVITRFFQGIACSAGNCMVGGSVADMWAQHERGMPMSVYLWFNFMGQAVAPVISNGIISRTTWKWTFGYQAILSAVYGIIMFATIKETRASVLLRRRVSKLQAEADEQGVQVKYVPRSDEGRVPLRTAMLQSCTRPFRMLMFEPITTAFSIWAAFAWGMLFLTFSSVGVAYSDAYGWNSLQSSIVLLAIGLGASLSWLLHLHQEWLFRRDRARAQDGRVKPEARLYYGCVGGVIYPVGMWWYARTCIKTVHPAVSIVGFVICQMGTFLIYDSTWEYLSDTYEEYASSALAACSFLRNMWAGVFPLFGVYAYGGMKPQNMTSILAGIATVLGVVPFVLFFHGEKIRARSKMATSIGYEAEDAAHEVVMASNDSQHHAGDAHTPAESDKLPEAEQA